MPPPKRPFTTSSLTSTLKSTIANQPLLSNLNEKIASQASSFAQKASPFFGTSLENANNSQHQASSKLSPSNTTPSPIPTIGNNNNNMMQQQRPPTVASSASTPAVDMSHLTEEERLMIQSVMAKAEMADMGLPTDSMPGPSTAAINKPAFQQHDLQQQQNNQVNNNNFNHQNTQQQQQHQQNQNAFLISNQQQQQPQQMQQQPQQMQNQQYPQQNMQQPNNQSAIIAFQNQVRPNINQGASGYMNMNQVNQNQQQQQQDPLQQHQQTSQQPQNFQTNQQNPAQQMPSLEQQTSQLVNQINSQFGLGRESHKPQLQQQQQPQQFAMNNNQNFNQSSIMPNSQLNVDQVRNLPQQSLTNMQQQQPFNRSIDLGLMQQHAQPQQQLLNQTPIGNMMGSQARQCNQSLDLALMQNPQMNQMTRNNLDAMDLAVHNLNTSQNLNQPGFSLGLPNQQQNLQQTPNGQFQPVLQNQQLPQTMNMQQAPSIVDNRNLTNLTGPSETNQAGYVHGSLAESIGADWSVPQDRQQNQFGSIQHRARQASFEGLSTSHDYTSRVQFGVQENDGRHHNHYRRDQPYADKFDETNAPPLSRDSRHAPKYRQLPQPYALDSRSNIDSPNADHNSTHHSEKDARQQQHHHHQQQHHQTPKQNHRFIKKAEHAIDSPYDSPIRSPDEEIHETIVVKNDKPYKDKSTVGKKANSSTTEAANNDNNKTNSDDALKLLSELKLTEQANQVMEQQQMLIKQSQELIKLQLEQQALSQELRKSLNTTTKANEQNDSENNKAPLKDTSNNEENKVISDKASNQPETSQTGITAAKPNKQASSLVSDKRKNSNDSLVLHTSKGGEGMSSASTKKLTTFNEDAAYDSEKNRGQKSNYASKWDDLDDGEWSLRSDERKSERVGSERSFSRENRVKGARGTPTGAGRPSSSSTIHATRLTRDATHSPTDTTDSDFEPPSVASHLSNNKRNVSNTSNKQSQHQPQNSRARSLTRTRREPTGLPPSPLPVAAAIQLHQMQQQHYRNLNRANASSCAVNRTNFLRSRSVTSSPNHHLDIAGGYMTDSQRMRSASPDTMSDFGGLQRKRKRLPEPPSNAIPLTPSMVRKMIQAQKAGQQPSAVKLLNSVNIQSTNITNSHAKSSILDKDPLQTAREAHRSGVSAPTTNISSFTPSRSPLHSLSSNISSSSAARQGGVVQPTRSATNPVSSSELNRFLTSTYGNSILKGTTGINKESPETVNKLISNWDEFYRSDTKHRPAYFNPEYKFSECPSDGIHHAMDDSLSPLHSSFNRQSNKQMTNNYHQPHSLMRRNSDGEYTLTSRLDDYNRYPSRAPVSGDLSAESSYMRSSGAAFPSSSALHLQNHRARAGLLHGTSTSAPYNRQEPSSSTPSYGTSSMSRVDRLSHNNPYSDQYAPRSYSPLVGFNVSPSSDWALGQSGGYSALNNAPITTGSKYRSQLGEHVLESDRYHPSGYKYANDLSGANRYDNQSYRTDASTSAAPRAYPQARPHIGQLNYRSLDFDRSPLSSSWNANQTIAEPLLPRKPYAQYSSRQMAGLESGSSHVNDKLSYPNSPYKRSELSTLTKDEILNYGPKFSSIGYRYQTGNSNKYVVPVKTSLCLQSNYPYPYKRILLCKNPKDRIGNGIGVQIVGGVTKFFGRNGSYDKVNKCVVTCGAFVNQVFQHTNPYSMDEIREGDQIIEWNGVNLCNRSNEEVQQILLMTNSDDEVEIVFLPANAMRLAYEGELPSDFMSYDLSSGLNQSSAAAPTSLPVATNIDEFLMPSQAQFSSSYYPSQQHSPNKTPTRHKFYSGLEPTMNSLSQRFSLSSIANMWSK